MKMEQVLHMNGGMGESSYASNSYLQRTVISMAKLMLEESTIGLVEQYSPNLPECLNIADFGCSSGPNTLMVVSQIVETINATLLRLNRQPPLLQVYLNDLPGNDFDTLFRSLPSFSKKLEREKGIGLGRCFIAGVPGSFYGRLFPSNSLHLVHSSSSLHWLSQVPKGLVSETGLPLNKGNICIAKTSPPAVHKAYLEQFQRDFTLFLKSRAEEVVPGGRMVLTILSSFRSEDPRCIWEVVGLKLNDMVLEGAIQEAKLDSFNMPFYRPTASEIENVIEAEGSFFIRRVDTFEMGWDAHIGHVNQGSAMGKGRRGEMIAAAIRAGGEPILASHFGEAILDDLFRRFKEIVVDHMEKETCKYMKVVVSLTKKG
ncbi:probable jasmonic acid carboxyl methyltransferase 2 [Malania oleifera]|uniref:probable jasmonic acid carboxyl methyltransferase 2 n=1 Tax=Malania oleifera TaxID=397392 RepID=UPI0025AE7873|nr:probable jasmonic acid carboxyl methyltransferase 2 [Malania oleifera]